MTLRARLEQLRDGYRAATPPRTNSARKIDQLLKHLDTALYVETRELQAFASALSHVRLADDLKRILEEEK